MTKFIPWVLIAISFALVFWPEKPEKGGSDEYERPVRRRKRPVRRKKEATGVKARAK